MVVIPSIWDDIIIFRVVFLASVWAAGTINLSDKCWSRLPLRFTPNNSTGIIDPLLDVRIIPRAAVDDDCSGRRHLCLTPQVCHAGNRTSLGKRALLPALRSGDLFGQVFIERAAGKAGNRTGSLSRRGMLQRQESQEAPRPSRRPASDSAWAKETRAR